MHNDHYGMFFHFWWLIFPLFWMIAMMARLWSRHARANRSLDILQAYVQQGKEPSPEMLAALQGQGYGSRWDGRYGGRHSPESYWRRFFFFAALSAAFGLLAFWPELNAATHMHSHFGFIFLALILGAMALASLLSAMMRPSVNGPPSDKSPPQ